MSNKDELIDMDEGMLENDQASPSADASVDSMRILEAVLFASDELMTAVRLKSILPDNPDARVIRKMVDKINVQLQKERHPFEIVEIGGGYQFRTVSFYHTWVRQIFKEKASKKLSIQALECLAIIAYKQPISKAEIEAIRGVVSDGAMKTLLEKKLVTMTGRSDKPGRPLLYGTTQEFLRYFGLNKVVDLPKIEEFEAIAREKMEELTIEELQKPENELDEEKLANEKIPAESTSGPEVVIPESTAVFEISPEAEIAAQDKADGISLTEPFQEETNALGVELEHEVAEFELIDHAEEDDVPFDLVDDLKLDKKMKSDDFDGSELGNEFEVKPVLDENETFEEKPDEKIDFEIFPNIEEQFTEKNPERKGDIFEPHETETEYDVKAMGQDSRDEEEEFFELPESRSDQSQKEDITEVSSEKDKKDDDLEVDLENLK